MGGDMLGWADAWAESKRFIFHPAHTEDPVFRSPNRALTLYVSTQLYRCIDIVIIPDRMGSYYKYRISE